MRRGIRHIARLACSGRARPARPRVRFDRKSAARGPFGPASEIGRGFLRVRRGEGPGCDASFGAAAVAAASHRKQRDREHDRDPLACSSRTRPALPEANHHRSLFDAVAHRNELGPISTNARRLRQRPIRQQVNDGRDPDRSIIAEPHTFSLSLYRTRHPGSAAFLPHALLARVVAAQKCELHGYTPMCH